MNAEEVYALLNKKIKKGGIKSIIYGMLKWLSKPVIKD